MLTESLLRQLDSLYHEGVAHDAGTGVRRERRLNITPDTGRFLYQLVRFGNARRILEVGTSNGYSTLWLAAAADDIDGRVISLDIEADKQTAARAQLAAAGLDHCVTLFRVDASAWIAAAPDDAFDLLFLDADRSRYAGDWPHLQRLLRRGGLIVVDNAISHAAECAGFLDLVAATPGYVVETLALGKGECLILKA